MKATHINTGVCAVELKFCSTQSVVAMVFALHLLPLPWKHKNDDWHEALSEVGQEHLSQVELNQIYYWAEA